MSLFLLRHGETVFNVAGRFQGQHDSDLTETGSRQVRQNGQLLSQLIDNVNRVHFVSSPLGRTLATSRIICKALGLKFETVNTDARLMEINFGSWQGMTGTEIDNEYPGLWDQRSADPLGFVIPGGGENYDDLFTRVDSWLEDTQKFWDGEAVWIAVSHGEIGSVIRGRYLDLNIHEIRALNDSHELFFELWNGQIISHSPKSNK